jgi:3-oxoacyl-[acyl-carrier-protein] synthase-3
MDGKEVFRLAVLRLPEIAETTLAAAGITTEQLNWFIPHQANIRIMDSAIKRLGLAPEKMISTIEEQANTCAASVGISLDISVRNGRIKRGDKILLAAMGGGFTLGAIALEY